MPRLIVLGDSHVVALAEGYEALAGEATEGFGEVLFLKLFDGPENMVPFFQAREDRIEFLDGRVTGEVMAALGRPALLGGEADTVYAFSMGVMTTLLVRLPDWKFAAPSGAAAFIENKRIRRRLMSEQVVKAIAVDQQQQVIAFAAAARAIGLRSLIIAAPPVRDDERAMERGRHPAVVLEVDRLSRDILIETFEQQGTPVVLPPPEACQEGTRFLRRDLCRIAPRDTHHGNSAYGAMMIKRVIDRARLLV